MKSLLRFLLALIFFEATLAFQVKEATDEVAVVKKALDTVGRDSTWSGSLSLSKEWALKFDEETGRGEFLTENKKMELHSNLLRVAEILHIIPQGSSHRYKEALQQGNTSKALAVLETSEVRHFLNENLPVPVDLETLRRHGLTTLDHFSKQASSHLHGNLPKTSEMDKQVFTADIIVTSSPVVVVEDQHSRQVSPRLAMHQNKIQ